MQVLTIGIEQGKPVVYSSFLDLSRPVAIAMACTILRKVTEDLAVELAKPEHRAKIEKLEKDDRLYGEQGAT